MKKENKDFSRKDRVMLILTEFVIASVFGVLASYIPFTSLWYAFGIAFIVAFTIGAFREMMFIHHNGHHFHITHLLYDLIGCLLGASVVFVAEYITLVPIIGTVLP